MNENDKTIMSYEVHFQDYITANMSATLGGLRSWVDKVLTFISKNGLILELGSAYGRDADYIESQGFRVIRTDAVRNFVDLMRSQGHSASILNALKDDFGSGYDGLYANAVFLHFNPDQLANVLQKSLNCLKSEGILAFSVKKGQGDNWSSHNLGAPRYFYFWQRNDLIKTVEDASFSILEVSERTGSGDNEWLQVIAKK